MYEGQDNVRIDGLVTKLKWIKAVEYEEPMGNIGRC